mmetsp:Transcript_13957/g.38069  ORF Transcript_13957/g.38069 Transcript_13957/m.38069 type:complete len:298 (-) Transcript_13957:2091-2984(-)
MLEVLLAAEVVALELDAGDGVGLPLADRDRNADALLVRRDRHLGGGDVELQIATVQVVAADRFQVGVELGARVAVGLGVPGQPAGRRLLQQAEQRALGEHLAPQDADLGDLGRLALGHVEADIDAVALDRGDGGRDLGAVEAAREVLALEFLLGTVGQRLVEGLALADADVLQRFGQGLGVELLEADEVDVGDDRALVDDDDDGIALDADANVLEQAGCEQRAQRRGAFFIVVRVTDAEGQRREHGAGVGALQAFDADVLQHEGVDRPGQPGLEHPRESQSQQTEARGAMRRSRTVE